MYCLLAYMTGSCRIYNNLGFKSVALLEANKAAFFEYISQRNRLPKNEIQSLLTRPRKKGSCKDLVPKSFVKINSKNNMLGFFSTAWNLFLKGEYQAIKQKTQHGSSPISTDRDHFQL